MRGLKVLGLTIGLAVASAPLSFHEARYDRRVLRLKG